jgi:hypothetical protein
MRQSIVITIIIVLAIGILAIILFKPEWIEKAWLWVIGLAGTIIAFFKRGLKVFTGDKISDIEKDNNDVKKQISDLEEKIKQTNARMDIEKQLYDKDIELLNQKIALKDKEIELEAERRKAIEKMHWKEYYETLSDDQKSKIEEDRNANTVDIN